MSIFSDIANFIKNGLASIPHWLKPLAEKGLQISQTVETWLNSGKAQGIEILIDAGTGGLATEVKTEVIAFVDSVDKVLTTLEGTDVPAAHKELIKHALLQKTASYATALQDGNQHDESTYDKASQLVYAKQ